jgi:hypothetical protein
MMSAGALESRDRLIRLFLLPFFVVTFFLFAFVFLRMPILNDSDSYYHLAVARHYAQHGLFTPIPWARLSLLASGGDKELLFHVFLLPFVTLFDPATGGRLALASLNAVVATILAWRAVRAFGVSGLLVPAVLWLAAPPFVMRAVRLRPEWLALIFILVAITYPFRRRARTLGVLSFLFALSYTAFHVFIALCVLWLGHEWWLEVRERVPDIPHGFSIFNLRFSIPELKQLLHRVAWPVAGAAVGLLLHPYPLRVLYLWYVQNVLFFLHKNELNVGVEIRPPSLPAVAWSSLGYLMGLGVMLALAWKAAQRAQDRRALAAAATAATLFLLLFAFMTRMATYAFPLVLLTAIEWSAAIDARSRNALRAAGLVACCAIGIPRLGELRAIQFLVHAESFAPERAWSEFGRAVPMDARVATDWVTGEHYAFWAPQGRYLNVLEPLFMALPYPDEYAALRRIYSGEEPDVPRTVRSILRSDYLAVDLTAVPQIVVERLARDPRLQLLHGGANSLYRVKSDTSGFVTDWNGRQHGAFVRLGEQCETLMHLEPAHAPAQELELAPYGPTRLFVDGRELYVATPSMYAVIGRGFRFPLPPSEEVQVLKIVSCRASNGIGGFYLSRKRSD